jgi:hypothetical protein
MSKEESKKNEPFFHLSEDYSSAFFGSIPGKVSAENSAADNAKLISNFIDLLTNPDKKDLKQDALDIIRDAKAHQFLVDLIARPDQKKHQRELVMACWETGLDFSTHLIFFSNLVVNCEYPVALEAITVIDEMHVLTDASQVAEALNILQSSSLSPEKQSLVSETTERLSNIAG